MLTPLHILQAAQNILLVDWPNRSLPRALLNAGFTVFTYSPGRYSKAELVSEPPAGVDPGNIFPPDTERESGYLLFTRLSGNPPAIDIVHAFRPAQELPGIIKDQVLPLAATTLWLHPPIVSAEARALAEGYGLSFVENHDIMEVASGLGRR
jgi:hypothetical protein